jgi:tetratricopeptide (TPR) repeat protein
VLGGGAAARGPSHSDLPGVLGGGAAARGPSHSDLPGVFGGHGAGARGPSHSDLPGVFGGNGGARGEPDSDLPGVLGGGAPANVGLPRVSSAGLPEIHGSQRANWAGRAGLPEVRGGDLPATAAVGLPDVLSIDLPDVHDTGLPDVLGVDLPEISPTGLPDALSAGLPAVSDVALPEVLAPGVSSFGRVDLPVPRPAELPDLKAGRMGFDEVDLPGVGESLPSVAGAWGEANLPLVGETLPMAKQRSFDAAETPFGAFDSDGQGDPFAGSEAEFGSPEGDPFGAPAGDAFGAEDDEFAPAQASPDARGGHAPAGGSGYGEVDIGDTEVGDSLLETADDNMEFQAIPQRADAPPGRAAASASVHTDSFDGDAAGSTLELGPERKAPKQRRRRAVALAAIGLATIAGGAFALVPAVGPFGIHFVVDQIKRGEHERLATKLVGDAREAEGRDTLAALQAPLKALEQAHDVAPRFQPLSLHSAIHHYKAVLRHGPLPNAETTAKVALDQADPDADDTLARLARAARSAVARSADAKAQLQALGGEVDAQELLGELSLRESDWAGANNVWTALAKTQPDSARVAFGVARAALGLGKLSEAMTAARRVLALNPEHVGAPILMLEAQRSLLRENTEKAAEADSTEQLAAAVTRVLPKASPGEAALAHCVLGELHSSQGRAQPAQQEFEAALLIDRSLPRALIGLGEVLHQAGRHTEALARFEAAAHAEPKSMPALLGIAKSQIELAHLKEAKAALTQLSADHKDDPDVIFWMAKAEQALGENDAALAAYRAAIVAAKGKPSSVDAYLSLAKLQADLGQLSLAQDTLSEARDKLPPSGPLHKALGEIALSRAEYGNAYDHFQKALELEADDTRARFLGAIALTRMGRFEEALRAFQTVSDTDKDFPGLAVERGRLFEESGRNAEALAEYESALKKTPDDPDVQIRVGCSRIVAGQAAAAQELLDKAIKVRTRSAEASYCLGRALFEQERYPDAMMRLERAISIDDTRAIYYQYAGWVATEIGRQGDAQTDFDKAIELDKGLADAYWLRGRLRLKQGAAKDAILDLERARQLKPSRYDAVADLAVAYADTGRMPKALDMWEEAIASDPDNPTWHFRYGKLLSASGNGPMATAHLKRAVDLLAEADNAAASTGNGTKPKPPPWLWQAQYLLGRELGMVAASIPHWQAYLRLSPRDDPYRPEAERALRDLGQPWVQR